MASWVGRIGEIHRHLLMGFACARWRSAAPAPEGRASSTGLTQPSEAAAPAVLATALLRALHRRRDIGSRPGRSVRAIARSIDDRGQRKGLDSLLDGISGKPLPRKLDLFFCRRGRIETVQDLANLVKPVGQHVLDEASQEVDRSRGSSPCPPSCGRHGRVGHVDQSTVRDRDPMGVPPK